MLARWRKRDKNGYASIIFQSDGLCIARVEHRGERPVLMDYAFVPFTAGEDHEHAINAAVKAHRLQQFPCTTLMDSHDYQLLPVDSLEVPQAELRAAIRWRLKEMIDFHVDDATIDIFDAPPIRGRGDKGQLYAVVSRSSAVQKQVDRLQALEVNLEVIDIPELALRNIIARLPENSAGVVMLYFAAERGLIVLVCNSILYLARTLDFGYRDFAEFAADPAQFLDRLTLEIQRSIDYYDRHFHQAQVTNIVLAPVPGEASWLGEGLHASIGLPVRNVSLEEVVETTQPINSEDAAHCFLAVGAALRQETASL